MTDGRLRGSRGEAAAATVVVLGVVVLGLLLGPSTPAWSIEAPATPSPSDATTPDGDTTTAAPTPAPNATPTATATSEEVVVAVIGHDDGVAVSVDDNQLDLSLTVESSSQIDGTARVSDLQIAGTVDVAPTVVELVDPPDVDQTACPGDNLVCLGVVPADGTVELRVTAELPRPGEYAAILTVRSGDEVVRLPVTVTYEPLLPTIDVDDAEAVRGNEVTVAVHETGGRTVHLPLPDLVGLARVDDDDASVGVTIEELRILVVAANRGPTAATDPIALAPGETANLLFRLEDLPRQGKFIGTLRFARVGGDAVEATVEFLRRRSGWLALLIGFIGAMASEGLRRMIAPGLKRTRTQLVVARGAEAIDELATELAERGARAEVQRVLARLRTRLRRMDADARADSLDETGAKSEIEAILTRARSLGWFADAVAAAEVAGVLADALQDVRIVERHIGDGEGDAEAGAAALDRIEARAAAGITEAELRALAAVLEAAATSHPQRLGIVIEQVTALLGQAAAAYAASDFATGADAYERGRRTWGVALGREVERRLDERPSFVPASVWADLLAWKREQPTDGVLGWFDQFADRYGSVCERNLRRWIDANPLTDPATTEEADARQRLEVAREAIEDSLASGSPMAVLAAVDDALAAKMADQSARTAGSPVPPGVAGVAPPTVGPPGLDPRLFERSAHRQDVEVDREPVVVTVAALTDRLRNGERLVSTIAILIAALSAVALIWWPNETWGSAEDVTLLALWAVGVHQFTGVSGTAAIRRRLLGDGDGDPAAET